jgi:hypothetical protein
MDDKQERNGEAARQQRRIEASFDICVKSMDCGRVSFSRSADGIFTSCGYEGVYGVWQFRVCVPTPRFRGIF